MGTRQADSGSASVEAAATVVCLLLVGVLIVEVGNYWNARFTAQEAASMGARMAASDGATAGRVSASWAAASSGCYSSYQVSVTASDGDNRGSRYRVTVSGIVRPRMSPWPGWAAGLRSIAYSDVSGVAASVREGE